MTQPAYEAIDTTRNLSPAENKARYRKLYIEEMWNAGNMAVVDEIIHDEVEYHQPSFEGDTRKADLPGIIQEFHKAFPAGSFSFTIEELVAEDDWVCAWLSFIGDQKDEFCGVPSAGKTLKFTVLGFYRFKEGKVIECRKHNVGDNIDFFTAMGIRGQLGS